MVEIKARVGLHCCKMNHSMSNWVPRRIDSPVKNDRSRGTLQISFCYNVSLLT